MEKQKNTLSYSTLSKIPDELGAKVNKISIHDILKLKTNGSKFTFKQGDYIENASAFNEYLNANVSITKPLVFTKAQILDLIRRLALQLNHGGLDALPMVCIGKDCVMYGSCSLQLAGVSVPIGELCPIEKSELTNHVKRLATDFDELPSYADQLMVQGVAACELLKSRVYANMSSSPDAVIEVARGTDRNGAPILEMVDNPNHKIWAQINKTEDKLLNNLHMTLAQRKRDAANKPSNKTPDQLRSIYKERMRMLKKKHELKDIDIEEEESIIEYAAKDIIPDIITQGDQYEDTKDKIIDAELRVKDDSNGGGDTEATVISEQGSKERYNPKRASRHSKQSNSNVGGTKKVTTEDFLKEWHDGKHNTSKPHVSGGDEGTEHTVPRPDGYSMEVVN